MTTLDAQGVSRRPSRFGRRVAARVGTALVVPLALVAAASGPALGASARRAVPTSSVPCVPTSSTLDGGPAVNYCGPATATLTMGGKTYSFKNGYCQSIPAANTVVDISLGTIAEGKKGEGVNGNAGKPYFSLDLESGHIPNLLNDVDYGGKKLTSGGAVSATGTIATSGSSKGTFKSAKGADDLSGKPFAVSGSWNCHGVFVKN